MYLMLSLLAMSSCPLHSVRAHRHEVGGGSRETFLLGRRGPHPLQRTHHLLAHQRNIVVGSCAAVCTSCDCSPFSQSSTCLTKVLQPADSTAMLSRLRAAFISWRTSFCTFELRSFLSHSSRRGGQRVSRATRLVKRPTKCSLVFGNRGARALKRDQQTSRK